MSASSASRRVVTGAKVEVTEALRSSLSSGGKGEAVEEGFSFSFSGVGVGVAARDMVGLVVGNWKEGMVGAHSHDHGHGHGSGNCNGGGRCLLLLCM